MTCPTRDQWLKAELGELGVAECRALDGHEQTCAACRAARTAQRRLADGLTAPPELEASEDAFVARVLAACAADDLAERSRPRSRPARWRSSWWLGFGAAAALLLWVAPRAVRDVSADRYTARGGHSGVEVAADVMLVRDKMLLPVAGAVLTASDALSVRAFNRRASPAYLMVFALDAGGDVHWLYPAYTDASTNPSSLALAPGREPALLSEVVALETPRSGPLRLFSLISSVPLRVRDVEARLERARHTDPATWFPGANLREWRCTWGGR